MIVNSKKEILKEHYHRLHGQPITTVRSLLQDIFTRIPPSNFENISFVGSGGKILAQLLNAQYVNEIIAQSKETAKIAAQVKGSRSKNEPRRPAGPRTGSSADRTAAEPGRNPKPEIRRPKTKPNRINSDFGVRISFGLRPWPSGLRTLATVPV